MALPRTTNDHWQTSAIVMAGGMIGNIDELSQAHAKPGSLTLGSNFESGLRGGYRRISGFDQFEDLAVTGTGTVLGVAVFTTGIIAARNNHFYYSAGSGGWVAIDSDVRTTPTKVRFARYNFSVDKIIIVDSVNLPATFDGSVYTVLLDAPLASTCAIAHANYMFLGKDNLLTFSAPSDETDYDPANGAGVINVGFTIVGLRSWRGNLYIFGTNHISVLSGTIFGGTTPDAILAPVTTNIGCIAPDTIQELSGDVMYLSADGIRTISGTTRIGDIELAAITDPVHDDFFSFFQSYTANTLSACIVRSKNQYRIFGSNTTSTPAAVGWIACIRDTSQSYTGSVNNWEFFKLQGVNASCADSGYIGSTEYVVHGCFDGFVYRQEQGNTFNSEGINAILRLPYNGFDDPELRKTFYKLKVNLIAEGPTTLSAMLSFNFGTAGSNQPNAFTLIATSGSFSLYAAGLYGTSVYGGNPNQDILNNTIGSGNNMALVFSSNDPNSYPYTIRSVVMDYQLNGRR